MGLAKYSKEGYNTNSGYTSADVIKDLPLINIYS
jgi:hypothetical protein